MAKLDGAIAFAEREPATNFGHIGTLAKLMQHLIDNRADVERLGPNVVAAYFALKDQWEPLPKRHMFRQGDATYAPQWRAVRSALVALCDSVAGVKAAAT